MAFTDELYEAARPIWQLQLEHPFVRGITDGSLEIRRFERWIAQDYLYLTEYARVLAFAAARTDRLESMTWFARILHLTLDTEMELHRRYAARFDITPTRLSNERMWPTTRAYTDFLVRCASAGDMIDLVTALLPCEWGYVYLAERMGQSGLPAEQRYADWITQYTSPGFREAADWLKDELDRLSHGVNSEKRDKLLDLFLISSRYELAFWEMCWQGEKWRG